MGLTNMRSQGRIRRLKPRDEPRKPVPVDDDLERNPGFIVFDNCLCCSPRTATLALGIVGFIIGKGSFDSSSKIK